MQTNLSLKSNKSTTIPVFLNVIFCVQFYTFRQNRIVYSTIFKLAQRNKWKAFFFTKWRDDRIFSFVCVSVRDKGVSLNGCSWQPTPTHLSRQLILHKSCSIRFYTMNQNHSHFCMFLWRDCTFLLEKKNVSRVWSRNNLLNHISGRTALCVMAARPVQLL